MDELIQEIYEQIMADVNPSRSGDASILLIKVKNAVREVKEVRNYPDDATDTFIVSDLNRFWPTIYNLAMYDFNIRGAEWESTINENGEYRSFVDRGKILQEVTPFAYIAE